MERKGFKEWLRKKVVYLKRNTRIITLALLIVTSCVFAFLMSVHSEAIMNVTNAKSIAFLFFTMTLSSFMSIFTFIGFKRFNKKGITPLTITLALLFLQLGLAIFYVIAFKNSLAGDAYEKYKAVMEKSVSWMITFIVFLGITIASVPLLPVISKLLGLINVEIAEEEPEYLADGEVLVDELSE